MSKLLTFLAHAAALVVGLVLLLCIVTCPFHLSPPSEEPAPATAPVMVTEDMPGWDCHTMGNRQCGGEEVDR